MATADWKVASKDRETGRQLMERSAIRNSCVEQNVRHLYYECWQSGVGGDVRQGTTPKDTCVVRWRPPDRA